MELFERTPAERIANVRRVLKAERSMRERVFRDKPDQLLKKVSEIDAALNDLDAIEEVMTER